MYTKDKKGKNIKSGFDLITTDLVNLGESQTIFVPLTVILQICYSSLKYVWVKHTSCLSHDLQGFLN